MSADNSTVSSRNRIVSTNNSNVLACNGIVGINNSIALGHTANVWVCNATASSCDADVLGRDRFVGTDSIGCSIAPQVSVLLH